ncbi:MAG: hypothetical protein A3F91_09770 [Flavobacteria bacterium RIFCSPLOWO2_12_FULL_35_11]|nr:MAG: hypothetical protein A3F91_09770 [Flavobacteria bacterium RIFCSPLOWO2_12_FULL_35_11]
MYSFNLTNVMRPSTKELFLKLNSVKEISDWVLVGGTALALYLNHRISEDLDFFTNAQNINSKIEKNIDKIITDIKEAGGFVELMQNDEQQRDYIINGVKVTFHTTSLINLNIPLCKNKYEHGSINIAAQEVLAAMKMQTIIKHRIKSRDFYDVYKLMQTNCYSFASLLLNMKKYYSKETFSEKNIEMRFLKAPLNANDEGLDSVVKEDVTDFKQLRTFFKNIIINITKQDSAMLEEFEKNDASSNFWGVLNHRFGLDLSPLAVHLAKTSEFGALDKLLSIGVDASCEEKNLSDKSAFHYLVEVQNYDLFKKALKVSKKAPDDLKKFIATYHVSTEFQEALLYEKFVNRAIRHLDSYEKIAVFSLNNNIDLAALIENAHIKKQLLKSYDSAISSIEIFPDIGKMSDEERGDEIKRLVGAEKEKVCSAG